MKLGWWRTAQLDGVELVPPLVAPEDHTASHQISPLPNRVVLSQPLSKPRTARWVLEEKARIDTSKVPFVPN